ncbi:MAG: hypothetical protein M0Z29_04805 [Actinomycetota bacterium]|nr:hypothetical protein [Actinomycetota bacterium]
MSMSILFVAGGASAVAASPAAASGAGSQAKVSNLSLQRVGTRNVTQLAATTRLAPVNRSTEKILVGDTQNITRNSAGSTATLSPPTNFTVASPSKSKSGGGSTNTSGFAGITGAQQAAANSAYDLEPPDQGLCSNGTDVMEVVNNAFEVYSAANGYLVVPPTATTSLFGVPSENAGSFLSDPHCYFDAASNRWFVVELSIPNYFSSHIRASKSYELIAVSDSPDPTGSFTTFAINSTDASDSGCPCFGDYPMIGTDAYGFYLTTNEFSIYRPNFNGVQVYAMSKQELVAAADGSGSAPTVVHFSALASPFAGESVGETYHLSPALVPKGGSFDTGAYGTEYFTMSDAFPVSSNQLAVYAMTNTLSLDSPNPAVQLSSTLVQLGQTYQFPEAGMAVAQKAYATLGQVPLLAYVQTKSSTTVPEGVLQADFDAVQQTTYAGGNLYTELSTASSTTASVGTTAAQWYKLTPSLASNNGPLSAKLAAEGSVAVKGQSLLYPDLAVNSSGVGDMVFTLVGAQYYPSAAYIPFGSTGPKGSVSVAESGAVPEDGFTCYAYYVGAGYGGCRWGDFSGAIAVGSNVWMATEYTLAGTARDTYTNWGTYVFEVTAG